MTQTPPGEPDLSRLREVFRHHRAERCQSYDQLARASGLTRGTLINIGTGKTSGDLRTWLILARTWDLPLDDLMAAVWR